MTMLAIDIDYLSATLGKLLRIASPRCPRSRT